MPIKVVVADDKAAVRLGIVQMLKTDADLEVAGEASTFAETLEVVDSLKPDIVVLDLHMPDEKNYLPESVKLQVREHASSILAISPQWSGQKRPCVVTSKPAIWNGPGRSPYLSCFLRIRQVCFGSPASRSAF